METQILKPQDEKISREFASRLERLQAKQKVRALLLLRPRELVTGEASRQERAQRVAAKRREVEAALPEIDSVLQRFGGKRLSSGLDTVGGVAVETTRAGIRSLISLDKVSAVLEDQPFSTIS